MEKAMSFITDFQRKRAIKSYIKKLPDLLSKDYGRSKTYTPQQVKRTIERAGLNAAWGCYAISMFSSRDAFDAYHHEIGEPCDYDAMRCIIREEYFQGKSDFDMADMVSASSDFGGGFGFDGGGFTGGGGDGGD
jgi:uncharacterized membrane protein